MNKPKKFTIEAYNFSDIVGYIEYKYNMNLSDFDNCGDYEKNLFFDWCDRNGYDEHYVDKNGKDRWNSAILYTEFRNDIKMGVVNYDEPKIKDFWQWISDNHDIHNESYFYLITNEDTWEEDDEYFPKWIKEILSKFKAEFGSEIYCYVSW